VVSARNDLIWKSWDEAWAQSRHLESMRSQYLGFFFTVLLAAAVFAIREGIKGEWLSSSALLLPFVLALGVELLAAVLLAFVRRIGEVLVYYTRVIAAIRDEQVVDGPDRPSWAEPWPLSNALGSRWRPNQRRAQVNLCSRRLSSLRLLLCSRWQYAWLP